MYDVDNSYSTLRISRMIAGWFDINRNAATVSISDVKVSFNRNIAVVTVADKEFTCDSNIKNFDKIIVEEVCNHISIEYKLTQLGL